MLTMKDLGHTLPGRQIKHLKVTVDIATFLKKKKKKTCKP